MRRACAAAALSAALCLLAAAATPLAAQGYEKKKQIQKPTAAGTVDAQGTYQLSADELAYDCKKLTGRMQIRILHLRGQGNAPATSAAARGMHSAIAPLAKGNVRGADPTGDAKGDRAMLEAFNRQLVAKGCRSYDLNAALKPGAVASNDLPSPTIAPPKTAGGKPGREQKPKLDLGKVLNKASDVAKKAAAAVKPAKPAQPTAAPASSGWAPTTTAPAASGAGK